MICKSSMSIWKSIVRLMQLEQIDTPYNIISTLRTVNASFVLFDCLLRIKGKTLHGIKSIKLEIQVMLIGDMFFERIKSES